MTTEIPFYTQAKADELLAAKANQADALTKTDNLASLADKPTARTNLGLGDASTHPASDFATAAQGARADTAVQPSALGSAASHPASDFATSAQGTKADGAVPSPAAPTTGDLIVYGGAAWTSLRGTADGQVLVRDSTQTSGWRFSLDSTIHGTGTPQGIVTAAVGRRYIDDAATLGAVEWTKMSGAGNTGWSVTAGDTGSKDITSLAAAALDPANTGHLYLRRVNADVIVSGFDLLLLPGTGTLTIAQLPVGYQLQPVDGGMTASNWNRNNSGALCQNMFMNTGTLTWITETNIATGSTSATATRPAIPIRGQVKFATSQPWPTA